MQTADIQNADPPARQQKPYQKKLRGKRCKIKENHSLWYINNTELIIPLCLALVWHQCHCCTPFLGKSTVKTEDQGRDKNAKHLQNRFFLINQFFNKVLQKTAVQDVGFWEPQSTTSMWLRLASSSYPSIYQTSAPAHVLETVLISCKVLIMSDFLHSFAHSDCEIKSNSTVNLSYLIYF